jgi:hypothetical protein
VHALLDAAGNASGALSCLAVEAKEADGVLQLKKTAESNDGLLITTTIITSLRKRGKEAPPSCLPQCVFRWLYSID